MRRARSRGIGSAGRQNFELVLQTLHKGFQRIASVEDFKKEEAKASTGAKLLNWVKGGNRDYSAIEAVWDESHQSQGSGSAGGGSGDNTANNDYGLSALLQNCGQDLESLSNTLDEWRVMLSLALGYTVLFCPSRRRLLDHIGPFALMPLHDGLYREMNRYYGRKRYLDLANMVVAARKEQEVLRVGHGGETKTSSSELLGAGEGGSLTSVEGATPATSILNEVVRNLPSVEILNAVIESIRCCAESLLWEGNLELHPIRDPFVEMHAWQSQTSSTPNVSSDLTALKQKSSDSVAQNVKEEPAAALQLASTALVNHEKNLEKSREKAALSTDQSSNINLSQSNTEELDALVGQIRILLLKRLIRLIGTVKEANNINTSGSNTVSAKENQTNKLDLENNNYTKGFKESVPSTTNTATTVTGNANSKGVVTAKSKSAAQSSVASAKKRPSGGTTGPSSVAGTNSTSNTNTTGTVTVSASTNSASTTQNSTSNTNTTFKNA